METGQDVICLFIDPLPGNKHAPPLEFGKAYKVNNIHIDKMGNAHIDVGLPSSLAFVSSYATGEELPEGDKIHWCHPNRFEVIDPNKNNHHFKIIK